MLNVLVGVIGFRQLDSAVNDVDDMYQDNVLPISSLNKLQTASRQMEKSFMEFARPGASADLTKVSEAMETNRQELNALLTEVSGGTMDAKEQDLVKVIRDAMENYATSMVPLIQESAQQQTTAQTGAAAQPAASGQAAAGAQAVPGQDGGNKFAAGEELLTKISNAIVELTDYNAAQAKAASEQIRSNAATASRMTIMITIAAALLSMAAGWYISRQIAGPIKKIAGVAKRVAKGDLSGEKLSMDRKDELGELAGSVDTMVISLKELLRGVTGSAEVVSGTSGLLLKQAIRTEEAGASITETSRLTDRGAQEQNAKISEMVCTLQEMAAAIKLTAAAGEEAANASSHSSEVAENGLKVIGKAMNDMETVCADIKAASEMMSGLDREAAKISEIALLISEIANQTNLLALNASIEAARAGEHGRGFGVVAAEVRKLAEEARVSSEHATESVKRLRQGTRQAATQMQVNAQKAEAGVAAAKEAGAMFREIAGEVDGVSARMTDLSAAMEEAFAGSEEIVSSAENLGVIAKQSASQSQQAMGQAEETVSAMKEIRSFSERLERESTELDRLMKVFSL
jgi:methyl-accepting chemotaxis protein